MRALALVRCCLTLFCLTALGPEASAQCAITNTAYVVYAGNSLSLSPGVTVDGNSPSGSGNSLAASGVRSTNSLTLNAPEPASFPSFSSATNASGTISPGTYSTVSGANTAFTGGTYYITNLNVSGSVSFAAGNYFISSWTLSNNTVVTTAANTRLYIGSAVNAANNVQINASGLSSNLTVTLYGTASFSVSNNLVFNGAIYSASNTAFLSVGNGGSLTGVVLMAGSASIGNNVSFTSGLASVDSCGLLADYRMDESSWTGASGEVADSSGNGYNAQAASASNSSNKATTASGSSAYSAAGLSTCGYGLFNRSSSPASTHAYVQLPSSFPSLSSSFTVMAWIRSTSPGQAGQRVIVNDDNQDGWALSLGDNGSGRLRFFSRRISASGSVSIGGTSGSGATNNACGGSTLCLDTAALISANTWYFVGLTVDTANKVITSYIYNNAGTLLSSAATSYTGTWAPGSGGTAIGGESASSSEGQNTGFHFVGNIDELRVFQGAMTASSIATQLSRTRSCPGSGLVNFSISGTGAASTCSPQTLTLTALTTGGATYTGYTGTVSLSTSTGTGTWSKGSGPIPSGTLTESVANSGSATYGFAAADNGVVRLNLANSLAQSLTVTVSDASVSGSATTSGSINFSNNAFVLSEDLANKVTGNNVVVAGRNHDVQVALYKKDPSTGVCGVASDFTGNRSLKLWRTDNGGPWTAPTVVAPALSIPSSRPGSNNLSLSFSAGLASFNLGTTDVGKFTLNLDDDSLTYASGTISGSLGDLIVRPFSLGISNLTMAGTANPNGSLASDPKFGAAGASFSATVAAYRWSASADADNDGVPDSGATLSQVSAGGQTAGFTDAVLLTPLAGSQTPASGVLGNLSNGTVSGFSSGAVTVNNLAYSEVGSFTLNTSSVVSAYLGGPDLNALVFNSAGAQNAVVGRFVPYGFAMSSPVVSHRLNAACSPASSFSYLGEVFQLAYNLTAKNAGGATTSNYTAGFDKLSLSSTSSSGLAGISGSTSFKSVGVGARISVISATGSWSNGVSQNLTLTASVSRSPAGVDGPFDNAQFGIAPVDSDGVKMLSHDLDTDSPANGTDATLLGTIPLRWGRLRLQNAIGASSRALNLPLATQYWNGTAFATNTLDSCSSVNTSHLSFGNLRPKAGNALVVGDLVMSPSSVRMASGLATLGLAAPNGHAGSVDVAIALASSATDNACLTGWSVVKAATVGANMPYLQGAWCGASTAKDPSARATFGAYRGADGVLFQRENY